MQSSDTKQERLSPGGLADQQDRAVDSDDGNHGLSGDDIDAEDDQDGSRPGKRKRPMSVS
jgi:hypothetical protein